MELRDLFAVMIGLGFLAVFAYLVVQSTKPRVLVVKETPDGYILAESRADFAFVGVRGRLEPVGSGSGPSVG